MGCINIEFFEETEFSSQDFGQNKPAHINAKNSPFEVTINANDIAQFENVTLITPRPGTSANKEDHVEGVRILTHAGNIYVVFADSQTSFEQALEMASEGNTVVNYDRTISDYLTRFKK